MTDSAVAQTLDRGLQILELLAGAGSDLSTTEIALGIGVHRTIAYRLLSTLEQRELVARSRTGSYRLASGLVRLAEAVPDDLNDVCGPLLRELSEVTEETVHLAVLHGNEVDFVQCFESPHQLRVVSRVGRSLPAHATSVGKALLATMTDAEVRARLPEVDLEIVGPRTIPSMSELLRELGLIRRRGYAVSQQESEAGVGSIGVAILDRRRSARAAISVAAPVSRLDLSTIRRLAKLVQSTARQAGAAL